MGAAIVIGIVSFVAAFPSLARSRAATGIACGAGAALALVFLLLFAFVHPAADDFTLACIVRDQGWAKVQSAVFFGWNGRVLPTALLSLIMAAHGNTWYRVSGMLTLLAAGLSMGFLLKSLLPKLLSWPRTLALGGAAVCIQLSLMPKPVEGVYWLPGVLCYEFGLTIGLAAIALQLNQDLPMPRAGRVVLACTLAFASSCCSETSTALIACLVLLMCYCRWRTGRTLPLTCLPMVLAVMAGSSVLILAPGNAVRLMHLDPPVASLPHRLESLLVAPPALIGFILAQPLFWFAAGAAACCRYAYPGPRIGLPPLILGIWAAIMLAEAPAILMVGSLPPRASDVMVSIALVAGLAIAAELGCLLQQARAAAEQEQGWRPRRTAACLCGLWPLWLLFAPSSSDEERLIGGLACLAVLLVLLRWRHVVSAAAGVGSLAWMRGTAAIGFALTILLCGNFPSACLDLLVRAPARDRELSEREAWLTAYAPRLRHSQAVVKVPMPDSRNFPGTISYMDICPDAHAWMNVSYADWYGIPAIQADPRIPESVLLEPPRLTASAGAGAGGRRPVAEPVH